MSDTFWLVFWGVIATLIGVIVALLVQGTWWIGGLIGLAIYLILLLLAYSGGNGPTLFFIDLD